jgi:hypothetical protein
LKKSKLKNQTNGKKLKASSKKLIINNQNTFKKSNIKILLKKVISKYF